MPSRTSVIVSDVAGGGPGEASALNTPSASRAETIGYPPAVGGPLGNVDGGTNEPPT